MWNGMIVGLSVACLIWLSRCFFRVSEGHLGVVSTFGAAKFEDTPRKALKTFGPGLHFKWPFQQARSVSIKEQSIVLSGEHQGSTCMAYDGTVLRLDSVVRFMPIKETLHPYVFGLRAPLEHITGLFNCLLRNEIANFGRHDDDGDTLNLEGSFAQIQRERKLLNHTVDKFVTREGGEHYGVQFTGVDITDILPPEELTDALNAVINAKSSAETLLYRAEGECQKMRLAAERSVAIAKDRAEAAKREALGLAKYLSDLDAQGVLDIYIARRRSEVLLESRSVFMKGPS